MKFSVGDDVVVIGTSTTSGVSKNSYSFCKVHAVGKFDLYCKLDTDSSWVYPFKVSKERCIKLEHNMITAQDHQTKPAKLGDLVLSITREIGGNVKKITGLLERIEYLPSKNSKNEAYVRVGSKLVSVDFDSLIVLEPGT